MGCVTPETAPPEIGPPGVRPAADFIWEQNLDLARYYPAEALEARIGGRAVLRCQVEDRALASCVVAAEEPAGYRFGQQAIRAVSGLRLAPRDRAGRSVEGALIELPIVWAAPD